MDSLYQLILEDEGLEYGMFNKMLELIDHSKNLGRMLADPTDQSLNAKSLTDLFPEFVGYDSIIQELNDNPDGNIRLDQIHREKSGGRVGFVRLTLRQISGGYLLTARDTTDEGVLEQLITQKRNELHLMAHKLDKAQTQLTTLFRRFVPPAVVDQMLADDNLTELGGERRIVTVVFADLRNFTQWAEMHTPEKVITRLNDMLEKATDILLDAGATVNQFMGDGFMSFFNAPNDQPEHAKLALECARKVVQLESSMGDLHFGVGVNTGIAIAGNVGSLRVMDYTAIGTTTNIASRFEKLAGAGEVVFGESTRFFSGDIFPHTVVNDVNLKGITRPVRIYKLVIE